MENLRQPQPMMMEGDLGIQFKKFIKSFELYLIATGTKERFTTEVHTACLLHCIGPEPREIYENFDLNEEEKTNYEIVKNKFENWFVPQSNKSVERHKFNTRVQAMSETVDQFYNDLKKIATNCEFGNMRDDLITDRIVCGIRNSKVRDRLLRETKLTLTKALEICKMAERTEVHIKEIVYNQGESSAVQEVRMRSNGKTSEKLTNENNRKWNNSNYRYKINEGASTSNARNQGQVNNHCSRQKLIINCTRCGRNHGISACPAYNKVCARCKKRNHFANCCKARSHNAVNNLNINSENSNEEIRDDYVLSTLKLDVVNHNELQDDWYIDIYLNDVNRIVKFKIDTGARINVIPEYLYNEYVNSHIKLCTTRLKVQNYAGNNLTVLGSLLLNVTINEKSHKLQFFVIETDKYACPLIGLETIQNLNILMINERLFQLSTITNTINNNGCLKIINNYDSLFEGIGKIDCQPCEFYLTNNYQPQITPCRKIPFSLMNGLEQELKRMENDGIISKITKPTEFVNPIVLVKKNNSDRIRICLDPQNLNKCLRREHYKLPTFEEITNDMKNAKYFTTLDANKGFWQIKLTNQASELTTFATPFGRFKFNRLPYGLSNAAEIFHRTFSEIFNGITGVKVYVDDIIIFASTINDHNKILETVLNIALNKGIKFNRDKCKILTNNVKYIGHIFSAEGIKVDPNKIEAINKIPTPTNKNDLLKFLGMVTYISKFVQNLSNKTANLRELLKKDNQWQWLQQHQNEFDNIKLLLTTTPILKYYDESKDVVLSVDSSKDGLGAVLLQNNFPIAYASKSLNNTQKGYAQIEKEMLAITYGCQRFHQYLFGKKFIVESDHKPLESIFVKPLDNCPLRLQRMKITLQQYNLTVKYKPGKHLYLADALSRSSQEDPNFEIIENEIESQINLLKDSKTISTQLMQKLQKETENDPELSEIRKLIGNEWPDKNNNDLIKPYFKNRFQLSIHDNCVMLGNRYIIPKSMRDEIFKKLHYTHMGIEKTIARAREHVYWPNYINEIVNKIKMCEPCLTFRNSNVKEPLINRETPSQPWECVSMDLFSFKNKQYLLIVDNYSKFPEVICCNDNTTSKKMIESLKIIFSRHGKPKILYSDNGPQFTSTEFCEFIKLWDIIHKTSSPHNPQSNGFIERQVQIVKNLFKKALYDNKDFYLVLLEYRNTPLGLNKPSPAQLLYQRKLNGQLPICNQQSKPTNKKNSNYQNWLVEQKTKQKIYYDRTSQLREPLKINDEIMIQDVITKKWEPGLVIGIDKRPRTYKVLNYVTQNHLIRNIKFLTKCKLSNEFKQKICNDLLEEKLDDFANEEVEISKNQTNLQNNYNEEEIENEIHNQTVNVNKKMHDVNVYIRPQRKRVMPKYLRDYHIT